MNHIIGWHKIHRAAIKGGGGGGIKCFEISIYQ